MQKYIVVIVLFISVFSMQAQVENDSIDFKYLEDQLYFSINYNILRNKPSGQENGLYSGDYSLGFIKDLPLNKRRNIGIGIGFGYNYKSYKNNLDIFSSENPDIVITNITNRIRTSFVEIPFELRWRTSTPTKYSFWRVYPGFKASYLFYSNAKVTYDDITELYDSSYLLEKLQYGFTLSVGYGTWNLNIYYALSPVFKDLIVGDEPIDSKDFSIGLKFYIL